MLDDKKVFDELAAEFAINSAISEQSRGCDEEQLSKLKELSLQVASLKHTNDVLNSELEKVQREVASLRDYNHLYKYFLESLIERRRLFGGYYYKRISGFLDFLR